MYDPMEVVEVCKWQSSVKRHFLAWIAGLAIPPCLKYLWDAGYKRTVPALSLVSLGGAYLYYRRNARKRIWRKQLIVITGCDSGLGYSLALHCRSLGAVVVAGVLYPDSLSANELTRYGVVVHRLNVTDEKSVGQFTKYITDLLKRGTFLVLHAFINNAGVMMFGEFEWQTDKHVHQQVAVNLLGTMRVTQQMIPLIRTYKSRIITISSHCALESLPGLSVYGATKAALQAWSTSLRTELAKHDVKVVSFIPGGFVKETYILARQKEYFEEMEASMSEEAKNFYGDYFTKYTQFFSNIVTNPKKNISKCVENKEIYETFDGALLDIYPSTVYKCESWRYFFYHKLFKNTPIWMRDRLIHRYVKAPRWTK